MSLVDRAAAREAATFVAREVEVATLDHLLDDASEHRVAVVTGAAGMGKTAVVRELARRAAARAYAVTWLDARELATGARVAEAVESACTADRPLLVVDSAEDLGDDERWLREHGLARLPDDARVVLVSRRPLEAAWWGSVWAASVRSVPVGPLTPAAAADLLAVRGVPAGPEADTVLAWAEGHPLSLTLAAAVRGSRGVVVADDLAALESDLLDLLTGGRLADPDLVAADRLVLAVAALAPAVDAPLLDAVLGPGAGDLGERWLRGLPFAERLGHRVTLHQRVRRLVLTRLREAEPDVERALRLRIIDHLADPAVPASGRRPSLVLDVREVLAPPQDHGVTPSRALASPWRVTEAFPGDDLLLDPVLVGDDPAYAAWVRRVVRGAREHVVVVRDPHDAHRVVGLAVWLTDGAATGTLGAEPALAAWLGAGAAWSGRTLMTPVVALAEGVGPDVPALVLTSIVRHCGLDDFRRWVVPRKPPAPDPVHCGGVADPSLELRIGTFRLPVHVIDYGPDGAVQSMREEARAALSSTADVLPALRSGGVDDVRDALRRFHDPVSLARSPLAVGADPAARARSVVDRLEAGLEAAFGDHPDARLQRDVLRLGYLAPDAGHVRAMRTLHLSRTTYFRRLREATSTLAAWLEDSTG